MISIVLTTVIAIILNISYTNLLLTLILQILIIISLLLISVIDALEDINKKNEH